MKKNSEFILGIIIGCLLTFAGGYLQYHLNKELENFNKQTDFVITTFQLMDVRITYSRTITSASSSSLFEERWNAYIYTAYHPWEERKKLLKLLTNDIFKNNPDIIDNIDSNFQKIHTNLITIRKLQHAQQQERKDNLTKLLSNTNKLIDTTSALIEKAERDFFIH